MTKHNQITPIEHAYLSMCDRINRLATVYQDPYIKISDDKKQAIKKACEAIEEEWIIEPSMRAPRD
jgi:hypothetical protein